MFPAAIAVFAAARASALQRRAFEAERRAEQIGQYALKGKLGEGGMGEVWLAEHALLKRPCAVKFIRPDLAAHPATTARFAREVHAVTGLTHVNTVRVYLRATLRRNESLSAWHNFLSPLLKVPRDMVLHDRRLPAS
jgi:serine/threonine-protein kinase